MSKNEEEIPKNQRKIAKCEELRLSENSSEKGRNNLQPLE